MVVKLSLTNLLLTLFSNTYLVASPLLYNPMNHEYSSLKNSKETSVELATFAFKLRVAAIVFSLLSLIVAVNEPIIGIFSTVLYFALLLEITRVKPSSSGLASLKTVLIYFIDIIQFVLIVYKTAFWSVLSLRQYLIELSNPVGNTLGVSIIDICFFFSVISLLLLGASIYTSTNEAIEQLKRFAIVVDFQNVTLVEVEAGEVLLSFDEKHDLNNQLEGF